MAELVLVEQSASLANRHTQILAAANLESNHLADDQYPYALFESVADNHIMVAAAILELPYGCSQAELLSLAVPLEFRNLGYGNKMLSRLENEAVRHGARVMKVIALTDAIKFYIGNNYNAPTPRQPHRLLKDI